MSANVDHFWVDIAEILPWIIFPHNIYYNIIIMRLKIVIIEMEYTIEKTLPVTITTYDHDSGINCEYFSDVDFK